MVKNNIKLHIIEDNERIADMYQKWLSEEYDVTVSYDGETALEKISNDVDVILLDRDLPGINGSEVLKRLRENGYDEVLVSMLTAKDPKVELAEIDCDDYIRKPVPQEKLLSTVENLVKRRDYDDKIRQYIALGRRVELIENKMTDRQLEEESEYEELREEFESLHKDVEHRIDDELEHHEKPDVFIYK